MSNFMELMAQQNTPEYLQNQKHNDMIRKGDSEYINPIIYVIKQEIEKHYSDHHISGYIEDTRVDGDHYYGLFPKLPSHNENLMELPTELELASYIKKQLDIKIRELGIKHFIIEYPKLHYYRETFMYQKYLPTFKTFNAIYIEILW